MPNSCPKCERTIPASAPKGLCPSCLVASSLDVLEGDLAADAPEMPAPAAPRDRLGNYELLEQLGRGGMGIVFRARDVRLNRIVALKLLLTGKLASEIEVKRFRAEAEAAAQLSHPNIVPIYEVGEHGGQLYFSMKLIEGGTVTKLGPHHAELVSRTLDSVRGATSSPLDNQRAVAVALLTVAQGVHFAHQHGILHRDLKPANILLDQDGQPFVTDFGLARRLESGSEMITATGDLLGTPSYMAPEVASLGSRQATTASDVYSLGAILYELLTGKPPFEAGSFPALLKKIIEEEPVAPSRARSRTRRMVSARAELGKASEPKRDEPLAPEVDRDLETICLKCLAKDPASRYTSARALAEELQRWLRHEPIVARPAAVWERAAKWARRKPAWALLVVLLVLAPLAIISLLAVANARVRRAQALTRLNLYAADMHVAQAALEDANLGLAQQILESHIPRPGEPDLRGFEWRYVWERARSGQLRVLRGHTRPIYWVTFSPNGNELVSCEEGRSAWFWNTTSWRAEKRLDWSGPAREQFDGLRYSPDGSAITVSQDDGYGIIFDAASLKQRFCVIARQLPGGSSRFLWSPVSPKLAFLATNAEGERFTAILDYKAFQGEPGIRSRDRKGCLVEEARPDDVHGFPAAPILRLPDAERLLSFTSDGWLLASRQGSLISFDVEHGGQASVIPSAHQFDYCERSPDGRFLAGFGSQPKDRHSILIDEFTPSLTNYWEILAHEDAIRCLAVSPDSRQILSGSADHTARVWDSVTRKSVAHLQGHLDEVISVAWSPDGKLIATGSKDRTVMLWANRPAEQTGRAIAPVTAAFPPWLLSSDGGALAASRRGSNSNFGEMIAIWNLENSTMTELPGTIASIPVWLGIGGRELVSVNESAKGEIELRAWEVAGGTNRLLQTFQFPNPSMSLNSGFWALSADRRWLALAEPGNATIWRMGAEGELPHSSASLNTSPIRLTGAASDANPSDARPLIRFAPDGKKLALVEAHASHATQITVWFLESQVSSGPKVRVETTINDVGWAPDSETLVTAGDDHTVKLWDARSGRFIKTLSGHKRAVTAVAFSVDGRTVVSGDGRTIKLWQASTGRDMLTLYPEGVAGAPLQWLTFSADSTRLLAADAAGRVQIFLAPEAR